jgi:hypothetical protein
VGLIWQIAISERKFCQRKKKNPGWRSFKCYRNSWARKIHG